MKIRIDKYLADMGIGTRSQVKEYIRKGRIKVGTAVVTMPESKIDTDTDTVLFDGKQVGYVEYEYFMLNKPAGTLSATSDKKAMTVLNLIQTNNRKDLFPVGRLDKDTEGLLLITNDGALAHGLLSPKKHVDKTYFVRLESPVPAFAVNRFSQGIVIDDGISEAFTALPTKLTILADPCECLITVQEGKFHQVKRMFEAIGNHVVYLKRMTMGPIALDETLAVGEYRPLTQEEITKLYNCVNTPLKQSME